MDEKWDDWFALRKGMKNIELLVNDLQFFLKTFASQLPGFFLIRTFIWNDLRRENNLKIFSTVLNVLSCKLTNES